MPYVLVVTDLQKWFLSHNNYDTVIKNCINEIDHAKQVRARIIVLEYKNAGKTISKITKLLSGYGSVSYTVKECDDGSHCVKDILDRSKFIPKLFKVVGVQTDMCVHDTVQGLNRLYASAKIHVIKNACGAMYDVAHYNGLKAMSHISNVRMV